jgi:hypothetical protein
VGRRRGDRIHPLRIIVFFTILTRLTTRSPDYVPKRRRFGPTQPLGNPDASRVASAGGME